MLLCEGKSAHDGRQVVGFEIWTEILIDIHKAARAQVGKIDDLRLIELTQGFIIQAIT